MNKFKVHQGFYFNKAHVNALRDMICTRGRDTAVYSEAEQYSEIHLRQIMGRLKCASPP